MRFVLLAGCCTLLAFAAINAVVSACVMLHWRTHRASWMRRSASSLLFRRSLPAALSAALAVLVVLPSFVAHEPRDRVEAVSLPLAIGAALGVLILAAAAIRGARAVRRTRSAVRGWLRSATRVELSGWPGPAWIVESDSVGVCVVGFLQPTLLVSRGVVAACTDRELAGIVAHERAHVSTLDNCKKMTLRCLPDVLGLTPTGRLLEHVWEARAEEEADIAAVAGERTLGVEIASALVKLARRRAAPGLLAIAFEAGGPIERRVRLLLRNPRPRVDACGTEWIALCVATLPLAVLCGALPSLSGRVHLVVETVVRLLGP